MDLYSELASRALLLHPALNHAPVSLEVTWANSVPERVEVTDALTEYLKQGGISVVLDGAKFLQVVPTALREAASPQSKDLAAGPAEGGFLFENVQANALVDMYGRISGRRRTGSQWAAGVIPYHRTGQTLSKPEALYALQTLLGWTGTKILVNEDNTFSVVPVSREPKHQQ